MAFCSAQPEVMRWSRVLPIPSTSSRRSGVLLDHFEDALAERLHQPIGEVGADALDEAGAEIATNALDS